MYHRVNCDLCASVLNSTEARDQNAAERFQIVTLRSRLNLFTCRNLVPLLACVALLSVTGMPTLVHAQSASIPPSGQTMPEEVSFVSESTAPADDIENVEDHPNHPLTRPRTLEDDQNIARKSQASAGNMPDVPVVREVEIVGAWGDDLQKAKRVVQSRADEPLDPTRQREDIRRLYELGIFSPNIQVQAEPVTGGVKLQYIVESNPRVSDIRITGNQRIDSNRLLGQVPVKKGEIYTIQAQNKISDAITRYYEENGFTDAVVRVSEQQAGPNGVTVDISVDEGTKIKIKDLVIRGNDNYRDLALKLRVTNRGSWGPFKRYYNDSRFGHDLDVIRALYIARGYLDVIVNRGEFIYAEDQSWVSPVIEVTEGPRYRVGNLEARGFSLYGREEILQPFRSLQGDYYDAKAFNAASVQVTNMYGDEGFLQANVEPDFHKDPARGLVDVDVAVSEGPRIYVGDVRILSQAYPEDTESGWLRRFYSRFSPPVQDDVVQREVRLRPGQVYRRFDEVRTRERLKALGIFEDVKVHDQLSADANVRDCVVEVTQGDTANLIFGVGFGDVQGGFVYGNYVERNLFGMARDLRVSALVGTKALNFEVSYLDRYFMGKDLAARFSAYHNSYSRPGGLQATTTGGSAEFTRPLNEYLKDSLRVRLDSNSFNFDKNTDKPAAKINDYVAATLRYRLSHDTRDDLFFPTEGHILAGGVEAGMADGFLLKLEGQYAQYTALGDHWVWASNNVVGLMPFKADNIGYNDRFFMGGAQDMRGFRLAGAGPHDSLNQDLALGGSTKILLQNELRYPFTDTISGVAFADVGTLGADAFNIGQPRASLGVGVRMRLPIAQVALDLAVPVVKKKDDQTQIFHFTLSSAF